MSLLSDITTAALRAVDRGLWPVAVIVSQRGKQNITDEAKSRDPDGARQSYKYLIFHPASIQVSYEKGSRKGPKLKVEVGELPEFVTFTFRYGDRPASVLERDPEWWRHTDDDSPVETGRIE